MANFTGDELETRAADADRRDRHRAPDRRDRRRDRCVVVQYPDILGRIADLSALAEAARPRARC